MNWRQVTRLERSKDELQIKNYDIEIIYNCKTRYYCQENTQYKHVKVLSILDFGEESRNLSWNLIVKIKKK